MRLLDHISVFQVLRQPSSWDTKLFLSVIGGIVVALVSLLFSPDVERLVMQKFHWRAKSFVAWSILQFVPSMYSFSNEIVVTQEFVDQPLDLVSLDQLSSPFYFHVNHFPLRLITFTPKAREFFSSSRQSYYVYLRSRYRDVVLDTVYQMNSNGYILSFKNVTP